MLKTAPQLEEWVAARIRERARWGRPFFEREAPRLARACRLMAQRFLEGGRLLVFGRGPYATDAMHVSVEFVHPVIVGKRALPALDLSIAYEPWIAAVLRPCDMVMGFAPPEGDAHANAFLQQMRARGAMTFAMPGQDADYAVEAPCNDEHIHQELFEILCHTLYESVHVFLEHSPSIRGSAAAEDRGESLGSSAFLYPFLDGKERPLENIEHDVAASILSKAADAERLRETAAQEQSSHIAAAIQLLRRHIGRGGKLILLGNGGSATDATDWALDCVLPEDGRLPVPAISLSLEPACLTAIANDVGTDVIFVRQLIAQASPDDVVIALSTSGGSRNVISALEEARKRGLATMALLGYDGGEVVRRNLVDCAIVVHCDYIPRIQEVQGTVYHVIREGLTRAA